MSNSIIFWFPCETLCPITLFEYGKWLVQKKRLFVGVHPDYQRRIDIEIQTRLERPEINIADSLEDLAQQVNNYYAHI